MEDARSRWSHLKALEGPHWPIRCGHELTADDVTCLREGLWPRDMDDRWAVWLDGDMLRCWRSWTSTCIYESQLILAADGSGVVGVLNVLEDAAAYRRASTDDGELERFEGVLSLVWRREGGFSALDGMTLIQEP
ncbi:hypothetical protein [Stenotrophomonas maltophilia]|uniref:hypothetical protein n=1 Tax=Stenotrophomonas maltophilia TaxID=40324 RepID=UPI00209B0BBD|nr:hypothetical protein [Stenotrophomonas maltophilia]MCO7473019.1 hypothetical protein [Stenotrophomonas maltophilia]